MVDDIVEQLGHLALGTRLKRLGERMQAETTRFIEASGLPVPASQFPLLAALDRPGGLTVGELAEAVGVSQPGRHPQRRAARGQGLITVTHGRPIAVGGRCGSRPRGRPSWRGRGPRCGRTSRRRWSRRATGSTGRCSAQLAELEARLDRVRSTGGPASSMPRVPPGRSAGGGGRRAESRGRRRDDAASARPAVWSALTTRQRDLAVGDDLARRFDPEIGPFAAVAHDDDEHLVRLGSARRRARAGGAAAARRDPRAAGHRRAAQRRGRAARARSARRRADDGAEIVPLGPADATEMVALAKLTEPGPFEARTPELGGFVGVRVDGRLVAMAGERMKPEGFTEVSGVCTHPDHRGHGYAAMLSAAVADRIVARGETPFLHAFASNRAAVALYERLGFVLRTPVEVLALVAA